MNTTQNKPFFSIVMPTRNRAVLLRSSLKTAVIQSFGDYEIVVCDNNSQDDTKAVVDGFMSESDKIRYVNPGRDLSMCDNWDFALHKASARFIIYLSDDDGLLLDSLSYAHDLITRFDLKVLVWPPAFYQHPDIPDPKIRGSLYCDIMTGKLFEVSSDQLIEGLCKFESIDRVIPKMLNCAVERSLIDQARQKTGRFFVPTMPDYSAACQLLSITERYHFIDLPLFIAGSSVLSNTGMRYGRKEKHHDYVSLFVEDLLAGCPYPMSYLTPSYMLAIYLHFQKLYPDKFRYAFDMEAYFKWMFAELTIYEDYDDVAEEYEQLAMYMREYSGSHEMFDGLRREHVAAKAATQEARPSSLQLLMEQAKATVRRTLPLYQVAKKVKHYIAPNQPTYLEFANVGSVFEASCRLTESLPALAKDASALQPEQTVSPHFLHELRSAQQSMARPSSA